MWLISGRASGHKKTLLQYSSLTPLERECYEGKVQPYRKTDYKPMMMMAAKRHTSENRIFVGEYIVFSRDSLKTHRRDQKL